jgi:pectate lyase
MLRTDLINRLQRQTLRTAIGRRENGNDIHQARVVSRFLFAVALLMPLLAPAGLASNALASPAAEVKAFPSAEGFGKSSVGGRGGRIVEITNLNDSGLGSLRTAVEATGPRIVVFRTGGTISLLTPLRITSPYITIAGQTAPGGGIALRNDPSNTKPSLLVQTHDVVVRYLRVRAGPSTLPTSVGRGIGIAKDSYNVIVDHCSVSWGVDTNMTVWDQAHDVTVQWSIISEGLNNSVHPEGPHSKGFGMGGDGTSSYNVSLHHNLFAHNDHRNPQVSNNGSVNVVNNVIYNYGVKAISSSDVRSRVEFDVIGNYVAPGPSSDRDRYGLELHPITDLGWTVHVSGNISPQRPDSSQPEEDFVEPRDRSYIVSQPVVPDDIPATSATEAYNAVLDNAGATVPRRDSVDTRVINDVRNGTGGLIDSPADVGGWPALGVGTAPGDSDHDGMPSRWESRHLLNPNDPSDGSRVAANGYTNVENYLNELAEPPRRSTSPAQAPDVKARFKLGTKGSLAYTPDHDRVKKGKDVVWKNPGSNFRSHTVTFWKGPWKGKHWTLAPGEKKLKTLTKKGTYRFRCSRPGHSKLVVFDGKKRCKGMCGTLAVRKG